MNDRPREIFLIHQTSDTKLKIGFVLWLKTLTQELDFSFNYNSFGIELKRGEKSIIFCGVRPSDQSSVVDFFTLLIDREELEDNLKLFCRLTMIDARPTASPKEEEGKVAWLLDPLRDVSRELLFHNFDYFWAEGVGEVLGCDAKKVDEVDYYELIHRSSGRSIAFAKNDGEKISIEPFSPFIASGLCRDFYCLGKNLPDKRFEPFFRLRQEDFDIPIASDSEED